MRDGTTPISTLTPSVLVVRLDPDPQDPNVIDETPMTTTPTNGQAMRYDATAKQYIYNLATKPLSQGTFKVYVSDPSFATISAVFNIKK